ncbi:MAG: transposase family protein [Actinobacteria bacterium]|nr:transposase family protein [Actinomycetota bacterium]
MTVKRVLPDNGPAYRSHAWRHACSDLGVKPKFTRRRRNDQRRDRTIPAHARRRLDLLTLLPIRISAPSSTAPGFTSNNQHRRQTRPAHHTPQRRAWALHLGVTPPRARASRAVGHPRGRCLGAPCCARSSACAARWRPR